MEQIEQIVTIVSFEEFQELIYQTGNDDLTIMELIDAIAQINGEIYDQTQNYGTT